MRKKSYDIEPYVEDNIEICHASCCDIYEIGEWCSYLDEEDYTYSADRNQQLSYSHDYYLALVDRDICGYFVGYDANILEDNAYGKKYDREFVILDTSSDCGDGSKYLQTRIFEYAIKVAKEKECNFVTVKKSEDTFGNIYRLCKDLGFEEIDGKYVFFTGFTQDYNNGFFPKDGEILTREELFELEEMGFVNSLCELVCTLRNGDVMTVDRETGRVNLEGNFVVYGSLNAKSAHHRCILNFLTSMTYLEVKHTFVINKPMLTRDLKTVTCDIIYDNNACICMASDEEVGLNFSPRNIGKKYSDKVYCLEREESINKVLVYGTQYDFEESNISSVSTCYNPKQLPRLVERALNISENAFPEMSKEEGARYEKYLTSLRAVKLNLGGYFCGTKKILFTFENGLVVIKTNLMGDNKTYYRYPIQLKESFCCDLIKVNFNVLNDNENRSEDEDNWSLTIDYNDKTSETYNGKLLDRERAKALINLIEKYVPNFFNKE